MLILENIKLAFSSLKANKMRSLLTMLGIIIGIASVIAIMTVGDSMTSTVSDSMSSMGANNITVSLRMKSDDEEDDGGMSYGLYSSTAALTDDDYITVDMLQAYYDTYADSIIAISGSESVGSGQAIEGNRTANINVSGTSEGYYVANEITMLSGRGFSDLEYDDGKMVAVISSKAVENLFGGDNDGAIGAQLQISVNNMYYNFTVVGVYEYEESMFGVTLTSDKNTTTDFYIPLKAAKSMNHSSGYSTFTVVTTADVDPDDFAETTSSFFNTYYRNNRNFETTAYSMASIVSTFEDMMSTITTAIAVIAGIALLVGGIGVMNIMLVSITERTREIGTRKALGAPNSSIRLQFIIEAIVVCIIGGIIGIILGSLLGIAAANFLGTSAVPSVKSIVLSISFSMAIGVFFGYYPANKAAKMDPIEALRYE